MGGRSSKSGVAGATSAQGRQIVKLRNQYQAMDKKYRQTKNPERKKAILEDAKRIRASYTRLLRQARANR